MRRRRLREPFVFFVDECLGRVVVPDAVRGALLPGEQIELRPPGTEDEKWLPVAGQRAWICLSKDHRLTRTPNQIEAIIRTGVALFAVGEANGVEHARRPVAALPTMRRAARTLDLAFVARVEEDGSLLIQYEGGAQLGRPRRVKQKIHERGQ